MNRRDFMQDYVLRAARGAAERALNVRGAVNEAAEAYDLIEEECRKWPTETTPRS